jgi:heme/copper-type cytochrome/quinol oxidase subunit 3
MTSIPLRLAGARAPHDRLLAPPAEAKKSVSYWGMACFCATESALFAYLLSSYFYLGVSNPHWPPAGVEDPPLKLPLIMTAVLLASSVALYWGERGIRAGNRRRLRIGTAAALVLGLVFLYVQYREYHEKLKHFRPWSHSYGAIFFTVTGFHGMHVIFGVMVLAWALVRATLNGGDWDAHAHTGVACVSLYWHTVDAVWLFIVASLYVSPHLY